MIRPVSKRGCQLERMRRRAVGEQLFAAAEHDRHREDGHRVDEVVGEERMDEFGTALGDEVRAVFLLQTLHVGNGAEEAPSPASSYQPRPIAKTRVLQEIEFLIEEAVKFLAEFLIEIRALPSRRT